MQDLLDLRDVALPLTGLRNVGNMANRETTRFINFHDLTGLESLLDFKPSDASDLVDGFNSNMALNARRVGTRVSKKLALLIFWTIDRDRRQLAFDVNDLDEPALQAAQIAYDNYTALKTAGEKVRISLPKFDPKNKFEDWDMEVMTRLSRVMGLFYTGIAYVGRPDKGQGWDPLVDAVNDTEMLMYQLPHFGPKYECDNQNAFSYLLSACNGTEAHTWIKDFEDTLDFTRAFEALRAKYLGAGVKSMEIAKANLVLATLMYTNENKMPFTTFTAKLKDAYTSLARKEQKFIDSIKVQTLMRKIQVPNNQAVEQAKTAISLAYRNDFDTACTEMSTTLGDIYAQQQATKQSSSNPRRVAKTTIEVNGVDISSGRIPPAEWNKLSRQQRSIISNMRSSGRGGRGRGRGGRGDSGRGRGYGGGRGYHNNGRGRGNGGRGRGWNNNWNNNRGYGYGGGGRGGYGRGGGGRSLEDGHNDRNVSETNSNHGNNERAIVPYNGNQNQNHNNGNGNNQGNHDNNNGGRGGRNGARFGRGFG